MKPSKPFLYTVAAVVALGAAVILPTRTAREAAAQDGMPLSTKLTPVMIDYFALDAAYSHPTIDALVQCSAVAACASSDTSRIRFLNSTGAVVATYDGQPGTVIEHARVARSTPEAGVSESRALMRRYATDPEGRLVMHGTDSIVRITDGSRDTAASTLTRVHRYSDVRYLLKDPAFVYPMTGLVVLELSLATGPAPRAPVRTAGHAAVSFNGTSYASVITTNGLSHRVNLQARLLETMVPDR
jgi:hypothetical protein